MKFRIPIDKKYCIAVGILVLLAAFFQFCLVGYRFLPVVFLGIGGLLTCWKLLSLLKRKKPGTAKILHILLDSLVALGLVVVIVVGCFVGSACFGDPEAPCEYVVVLGAGLHGSTPSRTLRERLQAAGEYLKEHENAICIVSGGQGPDEDMTEAQCMFLELTAMGIDPGRIWLEGNSTSTRENIRFSLDVIQEKTGVRPEKIGLLSSEYHLFRAARVAKEEGVEAAGIPAKTSYPILFVNYFLREIAGVCYYFVFGG